ncbi:hypothetical protein, partial [Mycobacterium tuberculosis]|uniref:hypothetical protein n=1 Tax=Mycobacterium tuberculosis TaxID=1773 RepID=UPI000AE8463D
RRSNSRLPTTLNARDQPPAEVSDQRVSGLTGAVHWIQALAKHFQRQLKPSPKIDISLLDDRIRFSVFVSTDVSAKDLCKLDDAVYNAVRNAGRAIENEQAALDHKLAEVRKRRMDTWDESYFR